VDELLAMDAHLADCAKCRAALRSAVSDVAASLSQKVSPARGESACLDDDLIARYVDGQTDETDAEIVETHVADCPRCAADVASLRAFRVQMQGYDWTTAQAVAQSPSRWMRLRDWRDWLTLSPSRRFALQAGTVFAAAATAALLVFLTAVRPMQTQVAALQSQVSQLQQTNDALLKQVSTIADLQTQLVWLQQENKKFQQNYKIAQTKIATLEIHLARLEQSKIQNPKSKIVLVLNDGGGQVTLDQQGNLAGLTSLPPSLQREVKATLKTQQVKKPSAIAGLIGKPGTLLGGNNNAAPFALLSPVGTVIQTARPTLRWQALSGATSYAVTIVDDADNEEAAKGESLSGTEWTLPQPLPRGRVYRWYVVAHKDGAEIQSPSKSGAVVKFRVLEQKKADELERARQKYANSHLTLGILYAQAGLLDDAEREFQALAEANPNLPVAQKLLQSVKAMRGK
jgi:anti-sigma factor RsiW